MSTGLKKDQSNRDTFLVNRFLITVLIYILLAVLIFYMAYQVSLTFIMTGVLSTCMIMISNYNEKLFQIAFVS